MARHRCGPTQWHTLPAAASARGPHSWTSRAPVDPDARFAQVPGRYPHLAALFADGAAPPSAPSCTGVAVAANTVLSSAACLTDAILTDLALNRCVKGPLERPSPETPCRGLLLPREHRQFLLVAAAHPRRLSAKQVGAKLCRSRLSRGAAWHDCIGFSSPGPCIDAQGIPAH